MESNKNNMIAPFVVAGQAWDYLIDAWQRQILFVDILRQRGNNQLRTMANPAPNVLNFNYTMMINGGDLKPAVNYMLLRIEPNDCQTDPTKRPFVVFDPRAGHGPGIGGMKKDSEIGQALSQGHPVYFVSFLPSPIEGQTVEHVWRAESHFVEQVISWHPKAPKPCLIGNCQAGWQIAMMCSIKTDLPGVLILAGTPLSYWGGVHGKYPMRYTGGMTGGSWLVTLASDLGGGKFDGAYLVDNFERNDPANTYWEKDYNAYSKADTEGPRFLEFERWWSNPTLLSCEEMQFIVDELFVGNHLIEGKLHTADGMRMDLRNIKAPIVIFCSRGDEITPVQQALGWILDVYADERDLIANGQTIVYSMHQTVGHLGLFVASSVVNKEHQKFISTIDMIDMLPPGLYEAVFIPKDSSVVNEDLASGNYVLRFENRTFDDIRALDGNTIDDDRCFEAVARLSENLQGIYDGFIAPFVRPLVNPQMAGVARALNPRRVKVLFFSDKNPLIAPFGAWAEYVKQTRKPVAQDNLFLAAQSFVSDRIIAFWNGVNAIKDSAVENLFFGIYGNPLIQACLGLRTVRPYEKPAKPRDVERQEDIKHKTKALLADIETGGLVEALTRGLFYIARADRAVDEREFTMLLALHEKNDSCGATPHPSYRAMARHQYLMLLLDEARALDSIPKLLQNVSAHDKEKALDIIRRITAASGPLSAAEESRMERLQGVFRRK